MMDIKPLERAARALCKFEHGVEDYWMQYRPEAVAVLMAIRDVDSSSPAILAAGKQSLYSCSEDPELEDARKCWQAMIDAALKEPTR